MSKRSVVLVILDGWGIGQPNESNPIYVANPKNINYIKTNFLSGILQSTGISVGLPWGEEGNSEVGHLNIGAGRIIYQHYPQITMAIRDGTFFENKILKAAFAHAQKNKSGVNLVGLLTSGLVHSAPEHLEALIKFAETEKIDNLKLHLITDGRDSPPTSALELLNNLPQDKLASLSGRFLAMDRDSQWEKTESAYKAMTGEGTIINDFKIHIKNTYDKNFNDEFVEPVLINDKNKAIAENDAVIFFNFREDRMRQLSSAFIDPEFKKFPVKKFKNLYVATMTQYDDRFKAPVIFPSEKIDNPLGKILADNGKIQFRIAETQKYAHITYFFNGMKEDPFKNEYRVLIPSKRVTRLETHPEMMASEITTRLIEAVEEKAFDFLLVNYANPDMIAHTGDYEASIKAVEIIDEQIEKIMECCFKNNAVLIITSDHGNVEKLFDPLTGKPETQHDPNPVPIYIVAEEFQRVRSKSEIEESEKTPIGVLSDVAPTVLALMGIQKPTEMSGQNLLKYLV